MSNLFKKDKGFTLIEIVLVMAIAGLILVIVFFAVQGAQRGRRDNARKHDAARMLAAIEQCAGNSGGSYTNCQNTAQVITTGYFNPAQDPSGVNYTIGAAATYNPPVMQVQTNVQCNAAGNVHPITVTVGQEQTAAGYCVGN